MGIVASATFTGIGSSPITGTTLNNSLGGSGTWTWYTSGSASLFGNGSDAVTNNAPTQHNCVTLDSTVKKMRVRYNPNSNTSQVMLIAERTVTGTGSGNYIMLLLIAGHTSLRIREGSSQSMPAGTDRASLTITAPGTTFWLELEIDGLDVYARVLNNDLSLRNEVTYTFGATPGGTNWGFGMASSGTAGIWDDVVFEDAGAGSQNLDPPLLTNGQTFYGPTVTGGAAPQILAPSLLTNTQTFYSPTVAVVGFTAAYVLANTAATGGNVQGSMYEVAGLVDPGDYMTYTTVSGPTPGGGTLIEYPDGTFEYTGGAPAVWVIQIKINGVDYFETTTVYLYDQDSTLFPPLLTNAQTFFAPTVTRASGGSTLLPPLLTNAQTFYAPTVARVVVPPPAGSAGDKNTPSGMIGFWNR